jgi:hypothetical protein
VGSSRTSEVALELPKGEPVLQHDLLMLVLYQEHVLQQETVPDGFGPAWLLK